MQRATSVKQIAVRFDAEDLELLERQAALEKVSLAEILRKGLRLYITQQEELKPPKQRTKPR